MARTIAPKRQTSFKEEFAASLPWPLDAFQEEAIEKLDSGAGVLVCAPTSSGKTVVAEYAIFRALAEDVQVIYTTPLKALSNQKFHDFIRQYGESTVGLVTGENTINDNAPVDATFEVDASKAACFIVKHDVASSVPCKAIADLVDAASDGGIDAVAQVRAVAGRDGLSFTAKKITIRQ